MTEDLKVIDEPEDPPQPPAAEVQAATPAPACEDIKVDRDRYYDLLLRKTAEFDNYRKRLERERQTWTEGATGDVIRDLLPVLDDLERALKVDAVGDEAVAYRKGVELIQRRLLDVLKRRNVAAVDAVGLAFDPHVHQAVTYEPGEGKPDGEVIEEYTKGYLIGERLLRPAMVKVAKA